MRPYISVSDARIEWVMKLVTAQSVASLVTAVTRVADMKTYRIHFYHGRNPGDKLEQELLAAGCDLVPDDQLQYTGSLDDFAANYGRHFIVRPADDENDAYILVTQYNSWSAR